MYKLVTFDIYSASLNINGSAVPVVDRVLGLGEEKSTEFFKLWRTQQWNYLLLNNSMKTGFESYRYITMKVLEYTEKKFGISLTEEQKAQLFEIWTTFRAWPEAKEVIDEIKKRGYKVGMLSNGDLDMLKPLEDSTGIEFDYIFSAEQAGGYKPCPDVYDVPLNALGLKKDEMLHVAGSSFDVMGAKSAGCHCAWSNRLKEYVLDERYKPDYELSNLYELLDIL